MVQTVVAYSDTETTAVFLSGKATTHVVGCVFDSWCRGGARAEARSVREAQTKGAIGAPPLVNDGIDTWLPRIVFVRGGCEIASGAKATAEALSA